MVDGDGDVAESKVAAQEACVRANCQQGPYVIREATLDDYAEGIWPIFHAIALAGESYAYSRSTTFEEGIHLWLEKPRRTYVVVDTTAAGHKEQRPVGKDAVVATYYIVTNKDGPGSHVCNCGYMTAPAARGKGLATLMCKHSQRVAVEEFGYKAMQFNFVAVSNRGAIRLWEKLGYSTVGRLPKAFNHPREGYIDALVMYKWLGETENENENENNND